jgi:hypothetical protein
MALQIAAPFLFQMFNAASDRGQSVIVLILAADLNAAPGP